MSDNKIALNFRLTIYIRYKDNNTGNAMSLVLCFIPSLNNNSLATNVRTELMYFIKTLT